MNLRRCDSLFLRLFLLMWVTLVASHLLAFTVAVPSAPPGPHGPPPKGAPMGGPIGEPMGVRPAPPAMPSLPPPLPGAALWWDYGLRILVIGAGAALGARWLSAPMRRLSRAAEALSSGLARGQAPPQLDERHGTHEVRAAAAIFNMMAQRLQEQFDARGLHMAALSHDLRTPLTRLRMRLEDAPPALADAAAGDIHEMSEMMAGTLAVLREQRDGSPPAVLDLRSLLQAIVDDHALAGHQVLLADGPALRARARPAALRRVVDNLVGNALRYGGSAQLTLQAAGDGDAVLITVDDSGPGIPAAQLEQAFQPWVRLDTGHARAGHGLGLAIARDLAQRDGGRLTLLNRPAGGLRAQLQLPTIVSAPTPGA